MRLFLLLFLISTVIWSERVEDSEDTVVHNSWIDPNDPTRGMDLSSLVSRYYLLDTVSEP